ncbi:uncharacterized protein LOC144645583 [Oculina patagonica]
MAARRKFFSSVFLRYIVATIYVISYISNAKEYSNDAAIARETSKYCYGDERKDFIRLNQAFVPRGSTSGHIGMFKLLSTGRYFADKIRRYPNSTSTFQLARLKMSGDICPNPGPEKCKICSRTVARNHRAVRCDSCKGQAHVKCTNIKPSEYKRIQQSPNATWSCEECILTSLLTELPFCDVNNSASYDVDDSLPDEIMSTILNDSGSEAVADTADNIQFESRRKHTGSNILMCHTNINSVQNKFEELTAFVKKFQCHIMFVSQTKIDSTYPNRQFSIPGYSVHRNDRKKGGGGVMALISSSLVSRRLKIPKNYKTFETIALEIKMDTRNMIIIGMYRPPKAVSGEYHILLENELSDICNWASLQSNFMVILGDLNLDRLRPDKREGKLLTDMEMEQGLECLISKPTRTEIRGTKTSSTLIDVILSNQPELFKYSGIYHSALSDHALIYGILRNKAKVHRSKTISFRSYNNFNAEAFKEQLSVAPWHVGEIFSEVDDKVYYWQLLMKGIVDEHAPMKRMRVRERDVPYMTTEWKNAIRAKRKATAKYLKNKTQENWDNKQRCRNEATRQRRKAIKNYWKRKADALQDDPRKLFNTFTPFLTDKRQTGEIEIHLDDGGSIVKEQNRVAELLVDHFSTIADGIGGDKAKLSTMNDFASHPGVRKIRNSVRSTRKFDFKQTYEQQVCEVLEKLDANKATGYDAIPIKMMKIGASELARPLSVIFNACIEEGKWPTDWRKGEWTPVFKRGDRCVKENYRPVTVLSCVDKVFEKLLAKQITINFEECLAVA